MSALLSLGSLDAEASEGHRTYAVCMLIRRIRRYQARHAIACHDWLSSRTLTGTPGPKPFIMEQKWIDGPRDISAKQPT